MLAIAGGFKDDRRGGAHGAAADTVTDFERLVVAFADEELIDCIGVDTDAAELIRVVFAEEGFEFGFVGWTAPFVLRLKGEIKIGQSLDVGSVNAGDRRVGVGAAAAAELTLRRAGSRTGRRTGLSWMLGTPGTWQGIDPQINAT